jgi:hypothetical protein
VLGALCQVILMSFCPRASLDAAPLHDVSAADCEGLKSNMAQNLILPRGHPESRTIYLVSLQAGVNFAVVAPSAQSVTLVLFTEVDLMQGRSTHEILLDPEANRTGDVWHILLPSMNVDLLYGEHCHPGMSWSLSAAGNVSCPAWMFSLTNCRAQHEMAACCVSSGYRVKGPHQDRDPESKGHRHDEVGAECCCLCAPSECSEPWLPAQENDSCAWCVCVLQKLVLLDPYAKAIIGRRHYGWVQGTELSSLPCVMKEGGWGACTW